MTDGKSLAAAIFANEADPAFRRRAVWIGGMISGLARAEPLRLLDVGCGRGFYFPLYAALGVRATGVELDPVPRAIAAERGAALGFTVTASRAEALPFSPESFDVVVMSEILEHLDRPDLALAEARRVLRPGGLLLATVPNADYPFFWDPINFVLERSTGRPIRKGLLSGIWANHVRLYRMDDLVASVAGAGFEATDAFAHTTHCLPFVHNIVYGLGRPLLEKRMLPGGWAKSAERGAGAGTSLNPVRLGIGLIHWCDSFNAERSPPGARAQNICLSAVKPRTGAL